MTISALPAPGMVIRYSYLWAGEHASGRDEGVKDRPAIVLAIANHAQDGETEVMAVAVTHSAPRNPEDGLVFPDDEKRRLGLDDVPSWIITTEANAFLWPGPDIRPLPGPPPARFVYGQISDRLLTRVARSYLANRQRGIARLVERTSS